MPYATRGGAGKAAARILSTPDDSPFANKTALDSWASLNHSELYDSIGDDATVTVVVVLDNTGMPDVSGNTYQWNGGSDPAIYRSSDWLIYRGVSAEDVKTLLESNANTNTVTDNEEVIVSDLLQIDDGKLPYLDQGRALSSPYRVADGEPLIVGEGRVEAGSIGIGPMFMLSDQGGFAGITNLLDGNTYRILDFNVPLHAASKRVQRLANVEGQKSVAILSDNSSEIESPIDFNYVTTVLATTNSLEIQVSESVTALRMRISNVSPDNAGAPIKYWPTEADWLDGTGRNFPVGSALIDFGKSPIPFSAGRTVRIEAVYDSGKLLGSASGEPAVSANLQLGKFIESQDAFENVDAEISGANYQTFANQSVFVDLRSNDSILLPENAVDGDVLRIQEIEFNGGDTLSIKNTNNTLINVRTTSGGHLTDTEITTTRSIEVDFKFKNSGWWLYLN